MEKDKPHSADVLNDLRDYWWSKEFLQLMSQRWHLSEVHSMLDVGCGMGHWGQLLSCYISNDKTLVGIDPEEVWVEKANIRAEEKNQASYSKYQLGTAESIPFEDHYFDMVTCQTVLVHVKDPALAIKEMLRVLKPGGLLLVAEPNNLVASIIFNNINFNDSVDNIMDRVRFELICERGRESIGRGNAIRGDMVPYYFYEANLKQIQVYLSDIADYFIPPYETPRETVSLSSLYDDFTDYWENQKSELKVFFLAGGGDISQFEKYWENHLHNKDRIIEAFKKKTLCAPGGVMMYLISGRKI